MPADNPSGFPYPMNEDPDRTIAYRTPQPAQPMRHDPNPPTQAYGQNPPTQVYGNPGQQQHQQNPPTQVYGNQPQWQQPEELGWDLPPVEMAAPPARTGSRRPKGWIIAVAAALVVGVLAGGGVWAASKLLGGGSQPQDVLPGGNAIAYVRLDLDPAANQKLALFSIGRKFSSTKKAFSSTDEDPRKALFSAIQEGSGAKFDYAKDIEPWLGSRVGVVVLNPAKAGAEPGFAAAIQVKDEGAAKAGIAKLSDGAKTGLAFRDGYAIIAETQAKADNYAKATPLAQNETFKNDLAALGEPGILSFWADLGKLAGLSLVGTGASVDQSMLDQVKNTRLAGALRFDGNYAELAGITRGASPVAQPPKPVTIGELPASTVGAVSFSGLGDIISKQWPQIQKAIESSPDGQSFTQQIEQLKQSYGLSIPDDLISLFGSSISIAVDGDGIDGGQPKIGAVLTTDPTKAQEVLGKIQKFLADTGTTFPLATATGDGKLVVASAQDYADTLGTAGTLGDDEGFKLAVPDAGKATYAMYVNLDKLEPLYTANMSEEEAADIKVLRAVGLSGQYSGGESSFTLRVLFN
ncbi:DUF3352 domain-containing protein [Streptosporangiaceae bacterium NEAU-GS5]|nr:DUF3352 domain-containing protein [Streptosporangiaceae bacterium NEAU-GS5]